MRLSGALSNPQVASTLEGLAGRKRTINLGLVAELSKRSVRLPQGVIQAAVLKVLCVASGSLRVAEIHGRRGAAREGGFSRHGCELPVGGLLRVERGLYTLAR